MNLKVRFALLFSLFVFIILMVSAVFINISNKEFRIDEFYIRLAPEMNDIKKNYLEVDKSNPQLLKDLDYDVENSLPQEAVIILDSSFNILYTSPNFKSANHSISEFTFPKGDEEVKFIFGKREGLIHKVNHEGKEYYFILSAVDFFGWRKVERLQTILGFAILGGLVLSVLMALLYVRQIIKPLEILQKQMHRITRSNISERLAISKSNDEVNQIAKNFNNMLDKLQHEYEMRKSFVQHASHELRTPLAVMLSQTEYALNQNLGVDDYRRILNSLKEDQQDMIDLTNSLLLLSKYDKITHIKDWTLIRIDEVLYEIIEIVTQIFADAVITVDFESVPENDGFLEIKGNEALIKSAIQNLIKNACHYSDDQKVNIKIDAGEKGVTIHFENSGNQLTREEQERLFIPFFRGDNSAMKKGFGLGLSIVKRIIDLHNGKISYSAINDSVNRFTLFFPNNF